MNAAAPAGGTPAAVGGPEGDGRPSYRCDADRRIVELRDGAELELVRHAPGTAHAADGEQLPLLLLHGFTGAAESWLELMPMLGQRRLAMAVSLPGHGASSLPRDPARNSVQGVAALLVELLDVLRIPRVALLGYSMGGRVALHLALRAPGRVGALVLESTSPGIADDHERAARGAADAALAGDIERDGMRAFVARWEQLPLWDSQRQLAEADRMRLRAQRLRGSARGLAASLRGLGAGATPPVHHRLGELARLPTLLLCGALDSRYVTSAREMAAALPRARVCVMDGAGHAVHLERPRELAREVTRFLDAVDGDARAAAV